MRQLLPTGRLRRRNTLCSAGSNLIAQRCNGRVIDRNVALGHHLLKMTQAERIGHIPAHRRSAPYCDRTDVDAVWAE